MRQKTGTFIFVLAFILLWACTPSSLIKEKPKTTPAPTTTKENTIVLPSDSTTPEVSLESIEEVVADTIAALADTIEAPLETIKETADSIIAPVDSLKTDSLEVPSEKEEKAEAILPDSLPIDTSRPAHAAL